MKFDHYELKKIIALIEYAYVYWKFQKLVEIKSPNSLESPNDVDDMAKKNNLVRS